MDTADKIMEKYDEIRKARGVMYATVVMLVTIVSSIGIGSKSDEEREKLSNDMVPFLKELEKEWVNDSFKILESMRDDESVYDAADRYYANEK